MTRSDLQPLLDQMRALLEQAREIAQSTSDETLRKAEVYVVSTSERAIHAWEGSQLAEVLAGTRPLKRWTDYGKDLATELQRQIRDSGAAEVQFSALADKLGNLAEDIVGPLKAKVEDLRARVDELAARRIQWETARATLQDRGLSADAKKLLFGVEADANVASLKNLGAIVVGLETGISLLEGGKATLEKTADGKDVRIVPLSADAQQTLGVVPLVVAAVTIGTVAVALAIATSVRSYFAHADEVVRSELSRLELEAINNGNGPEVLALKKLQIESDKNADHGGFGDLMDTLVTLAKVLGVVGGGFLIWKLFSGIMDERRRTRTA
jgi:hypothetical protein